jgi:hypothetical protein
MLKNMQVNEGVGNLVKIVGFSVWISRLFMFKLSFYSKWHLTERTVVGFYHDLAASFFVLKTFCPGCRWWNSSWGEGPALAFHGCLLDIRMFTLLPYSILSRGVHLLWISPAIKALVHKTSVFNFICPGQELG